MNTIELRSDVVDSESIENGIYISEQKTEWGENAKPCVHRVRDERAR